MFRDMLQTSPVLVAGRAVSGVRWRVSFATLVALVACSNDQPGVRPTVGTAAPVASVQAADPVVAPIIARWDSTNGPALYLPGEGGAAQVIVPRVLDDSVPRPDSAAIPVGAAPASIELFAPSGRLGTVSLGEYRGSSQLAIGEACDAWATVAVRTADGSVRQSWRFALQAGVAESIATDSLGSLSRSDSAALVVDINKAAAILPLDSAGLLRRVPFSVTKAYRLRFDGAVEAVIAVVERRLNLEAAPRVERSTLVLERAPKVRGFAAVWRETQYATEDDLVAIDLLGVVTFRGSGRPSVFLSQDFGDGSRVEMLQRSAGGIWSLRWSSAYTGC